MATQSNPWTPLVQSDMPSGAASQQLFFTTFGYYLNWLAALVPVTATGTATGNVTTTNTPISVNVTFPSGRFTTAPLVTGLVVIGATTPQNVQVSASQPTTTGMTIYMNRSTGTGSVTVDWEVSLSP